jgi:hypothetical protein
MLNTTTLHRHRGGCCRVEKKLASNFILMWIDREDEMERHHARRTLSTALLFFNKSSACEIEKFILNREKWAKPILILKLDPRRNGAAPIRQKVLRQGDKVKKSSAPVARFFPSSPMLVCRLESHVSLFFLQFVLFVP